MPVPTLLLRIEKLPDIQEVVDESTFESDVGRAKLLEQAVDRFPVGLLGESGPA